MKITKRKNTYYLSDYEVYFNECDYDIGLENDPSSYDQVIKGENSTA